MDLLGLQESRLAVRQFWYSLLRYLSSPDFDPQVELAAEAVQALYRHD